MTDKDIGFSRVFHVFELELVISGKREGVHVLESKTGVESVKDTGWPCTHGLLDANQLEDLVAYLDDSVRASIMTFAGVQEILPME